MQNGVKSVSTAFGDISSHVKIRSSVIETIIKTESDYVKTLKFIVEVRTLESCKYSWVESVR